MKSKVLRVGREYGGEITATFTVPAPMAEDVCSLVGADVSIDVKKWREPRSLDANAYLWAVCTEIADALKITKVEVYRRAIRDKGRYYRLPIHDDEVEEFSNNWSHNGIGWFAEKVDKSKIKDHSIVFAYIGSSQYTTEQFSLLVDYLIDEAQQIGITLKAGPELERLAKEWGK